MDAPLLCLVVVASIGAIAVNVSLIFLLLRLEQLCASGEVTLSLTHCIGSPKRMCMQQLENHYVVSDNSRAKIPRRFIRTGPEPMNDLHPDLRTMYNETLAQNPGWSLQYFDNSQSRAFIKEHFDARTLSAYDTLIPGAYKADLFRYCALYILGGVYADFSMSFTVPIEELVDPKLDELVLCHDRPQSNVQFRLYNAFMATSPRHELMLRCVQAVVRNVENRFYGVDDLHPTGPQLLREQFDLLLADTHFKLPHRLQMAHIEYNKIARNVASSDDTVALPYMPKHREYMKTGQPSYRHYYRRREMYAS